MFLDENKIEKLNKAILKKALGYKSIDVVEELVKNSEGQMEVFKRKISTKQNAPDVTAAKIILETGVVELYDDLTMEQLLVERQKILEELKTLEKNE
ncbi:MAG: hypothetical protein LBU60_03580 [Clostridiales bacterium]|jgi:hypothetical protein|nr:hypothetical protein [Clostridiales bacterium]